MPDREVSLELPDGCGFKEARIELWGRQLIVEIVSEHRAEPCVTATELSGDELQVRVEPRWG